MQLIVFKWLILSAMFVAASNNINEGGALSDVSEFIEAKVKGVVESNTTQDDLELDQISAEQIEYFSAIAKIRSKFVTSHGLRKMFRYAKYLVSIRTLHPLRYFGDNHFCTGAVVGARLILTAAHCVVDATKSTIRPRRLVVVAGTSNRLRIDKTTIHLNVEEVIPHEKYIRHGEYDIAALRLKQAIPRDNDAIKIITMPTDKPRNGSKCVAVGWGTIYPNGPISASTWYSPLIVMEQKGCVRYYPLTFKPSMICAENIGDLDNDQCRVDSGGALICGDQLEGIVSWGQRCCAGMPVCFTSIGVHRHWIDKTNCGTALISTIFPGVVIFSCIFQWTVM